MSEQKTTTELLIQIADILKNRNDVLNALGQSLNLEPIQLFNALEDTINTCRILDVKIPSDDIVKFVDTLNEADKDGLITRLSDILGVVWSIHPKAKELLERCKYNYDPTKTSDFVDIPETLAAKKLKWENWKNTAKPIKTYSNIAEARKKKLSIENALAQIFDEMDKKNNTPPEA